MWSQRAEALAQRVSLADLNNDAIAAIKAVPGSRRIAIACSGGADSTALVLLLWAHFPERRGRWLILHFDHGLRGSESAADAVFVRTLARDLGEKCLVRKCRRKPNRDAHVSETVARQARWSFFESALDANSVAVIATGHQADDVAESMLMRLTRGAGTAGLAGPRPVQSMESGATRVRPLLKLPSRRIRESLREAYIPWCEDRTNASDVHFRNRIRKRVVPALVEASPQEVIEGVGVSRDLLEEDCEALDAIAVAAAAPYRRRKNWDLSRVRSQPAAIVRRVVLRWLAARDLISNLNRAAIDRLLRAVLAGEELRMSAGRDCEIVFRNSCLTAKNRPSPAIRREIPPRVLTAGPKLSLPAGGMISARIRRLSAALRHQILSGEFSPDKTVFLSGELLPLIVRQWRRGDRYRPLGAPGRSKIQDMFVNRKIPPEQRMSLPVICMAGRGVIWVPGIPPAQEVAIQPETKLVVQLTYFPPGPMVNGSK